MSSTWDSDERSRLLPSSDFSERTIFCTSNVVLSSAAHSQIVYAVKCIVREGNRRAIKALCVVGLGEGNRCFPTKSWIGCQPAKSDERQQDHSSGCQNPLTGLTWPMHGLLPLPQEPAQSIRWLQQPLICRLPPRAPHQYTQVRASQTIHRAECGFVREIVSEVNNGRVRLCLVHNCLDRTAL